VSQPFIAQIMIVSFNFAPKGWALCNGQLLPINQNQALFSLLGTTYGGDGRVNFGLPNLQGKIPNGMGGSYVLGQTAGETNVTLTISQMPAHNHVWGASKTAASGGVASGTVLASANMYTPSPLDSAMLPSAVSTVGGSQPHTNMMPYLVLNYCIALQGIFPSQN
jgi:microcystin-dependent protein